MFYGCVLLIVATFNANDELLYPDASQECCQERYGSFRLASPHPNFCTITQLTGLGSWLGIKINPGCFLKLMPVWVIYQFSSLSISGNICASMWEFGVPEEWEWAAGQEKGWGCHLGYSIKVLMELCCCCLSCTSLIPSETPAVYKLDFRLGPVLSGIYALILWLIHPMWKQKQVPKGKNNAAYLLLSLIIFAR